MATFLKVANVAVILCAAIIVTTTGLTVNSHRPTVEYPSSTSDIINKLLSANYDNKVRPGFGGGSHLNVTVKLYTLPWFEVEEMRMEYSLTIIFIQTWIDERLSFEHESITSIMLNGEHMKKVWIPDTYFKNERKSHLHDVTYPNEFLKIGSDGTVSLETRAYITLGCNSAFDNSEEFPFDSHQCMMTIESFKMQNGEIMYHWDNEFEGAGAELHPTSRCTGFYVGKLTEYQEVVLTDSVSPSITSSMSHKDVLKWFTPRLSVEILFKRVLEPYITSVYIPLIIFTSISILSLSVLNAKTSSFVNFFNIGFVNIFMALRYSSQDMIWTTKATALDKFLNISNLFIICCAIVNIVVIYMESSTGKGEENIEMRDIRESSLDTETQNFVNRGRDSEHENLFTPHRENFRAGNNFIMLKIRMWMKRVPEAISLFCEFASWTFAGAFVVVNSFYWAKHL